MGRHYTLGAERVDLLDHLRQKTGDPETACGKSVLGAQRGDAPPLLLGWLPAPVKSNKSRPGGRFLSPALVARVTFKARR